MIPPPKVYRPGTNGKRTPPPGLYNTREEALAALAASGRTRIGSLSGYQPPDWSAAYGGTPRVPDPLSTGAYTIAGNLGNLSNLYQLAGGVNNWNTAAAAQQYAANLPDYQNMIEQSSRNIGAFQRGEVPADVKSQIWQAGAERLGTGQGPGSEGSNAAYLRALGLSSLGMMKESEGMLTGAMQRTPTAPLFDLNTMLVKPEDTQAAQTAANLYMSMPNPWAASREAINQANTGLNTGTGDNRGGWNPGGPTAMQSWVQQNMRHFYT